MKAILFVIISAGFLSGCLVDSSVEDAGTQSQQGSAANTQGEASRYSSVLERTLGEVNDQVLLPRIETFKTDVDVLQEVLQGNCSNSESIQSAWKQAMSTWQKIQSAQFGPLTDNGNLLSGRIYSWPDQASTCTVDRQVILSQNPDFDLENAPRQGKGLDALEYLLFNSNLEHTCSSFIEETQSWNDLTAVERQNQRCDYAQAVSEDLSNNAQTLLQQWQSYQTHLKNVSDSTLFQNAEEALNAITDSLFYLDTDVKDRKLAAVLGLNNRHSCGESTCAELRESPWSEASIAHIHDNLIGFKQVFIASQEEQAINVENQVGFDYHLAVRNFPEIADSILELTDQAIALSGTLERPLQDYISVIEEQGLSAQCINASSNRTVAEGVEVCALHGLIKGITDQLKTDFLILMRLSLPVRVEGDND